MDTAVKLNKPMRERFMNADLVVINCPSVPTDTNGESNYVAFLDVRTYLRRSSSLQFETLHGSGMLLLVWTWVLV
jgi:hypothetical protein